MPYNPHDKLLANYANIANGFNLHTAIDYFKILSATTLNSHIPFAFCHKLHTIYIREKMASFKEWTLYRNQICT